MTLYYWLFNRLAARKPPVALTLWIWRRWAAVQQIRKHTARRNWSHALCYMKLMRTDAILFIVCALLLAYIMLAR